MQRRHTHGDDSPAHSTRYLLVALLAVGTATAGCNSSMGSSPESSATERNASFLEQAREKGMSEDDPRTRGILTLANEAPFGKLDSSDEVGLDVRAARNIIDTRRRDGPFETLRELDAVDWVSDRAFGKLYEYASNHGYINGHKGDGDHRERPRTVHGVETGSPQADALLRIANTTGEARLDASDAVGLDARAAENIVRYRVGPDGEAGTYDDRAYQTLTELDAISWVEDRAFGKLLEWAVEQGYVDSSGEEPAQFRVTIENVSNRSGFPTPFAPGAWAAHDGSNPFFEVGDPEPGRGLEKLAEDGGGAQLAGQTKGLDGVGATGAFAPNPPGPILPGDSISFSLEATPANATLTFASMFVQSNDAFVAPEGDGIELFNEADRPVDQGDVTDQLALYDAGTETDQAPGYGSYQAPRQSEKGAGPAEGTVRPERGSTRALPHANGIVDVSVTRKDDSYEIAVENVSAFEGAIATPVAPVFHATHGDDWKLFEAGDEASSALETLAEDGSPAGLVRAHQGEADAIGAAAVPSDAEKPGPAAPGQSYTFTVDTDAEQLTLAAMVVQSNDAFLAPKGGGVPVTDGDGEPKTAQNLEDAIERRLAVWDAGTEVNEVPGVGPHQAPRQSEKGAGPADPNDSIRLYRDTTNDLKGPSAGGFADVSVDWNADSETFSVTVENTSGSTAYDGILTPVAWGLTDGSTPFFETGTQASAGLESIAEDGKAGEFVAGLEGSGIAAKGVRATRDGDGKGPIKSGGSYTFEVDPSEDARFLNLASMVVPSNDTFVSLGETGVALVDEQGEPRDADVLADELDRKLRAYDAGTEVDQAGAAGPHQAPRQAGPDTGPEEGDGTVDRLDDTAWAYPDVEDVLRVTVEQK